MNNYMENISTSLDGSRYVDRHYYSKLPDFRNSVRRIVLNEDTECSQQSVLNVMETFVKTVNKMDETILIPCRLMDQKVGDEHDPACNQNSKIKNTPSVNPMFHTTDLFEIYNLLNSAKDNLLWGQSQETAVKVNSASQEVKGHFRRPSSVSVASTSSTSTMSDTDSESGSTDSGIEEPFTNEEKVQKFADDFRRHLQGLTTSLSQMTEAAQYLTWRYQYDIGGPI